MDVSASLRDLISDASAMLLSPREVTSRLDAIAVETFAKRIRLEISFIDQVYRWGADGPRPETTLTVGEVSEGVKFEIFGEVFPVIASDQALLDLLRQVPPAIWRRDLRSSGGFNWKMDSIRTSLVRSVERLVSGKSEQRIAVIYADLDKFKSLNDQAGHEKGNEAIRLVNREMHDLCLAHGGLPFHPSGDEYYLLLPGSDLLEMMDALRALRSKIRLTKFCSEEGVENTIDITFGVDFVSGTISHNLIESAIAEAEEATKGVVAPESEYVADEQGAGLPGGLIHTAKEKRRGKISFSSSPELDTTPISVAEFLKLGTVIIRRCALAQTATFGDSRLGVIELLAERNAYKSVADLESEIADAIEWLDVRLDGEHAIESLIGLSSPKAISPEAVAIAVASGLLRGYAYSDHKNGAPLALSIRKTASLVCVVRDDVTVWSFESKSAAGDALTVVTDKEVIERNGALIGVQVGFSTKPRLADVSLPDAVFSQVVVVDDRPYSGGGLPDFWQAAVALVCQVAARRLGPCQVIGWSSNADTSETIRRLRNADLLDIDEITALSRVSSSDVRTITEHISNTVAVVNSFSELIIQVYEAAGIQFWPGETDLRGGGLEVERFHRRAFYSQPLTQLDGVRCATAAQAYPTVIDVLRRDATRVSADDAYQELRELLAFRILLESPEQGQLPSYLVRQKEDVERYANEVLLSAFGKLGSKLRGEGQLDAFKREILSCYMPGGRQKSTRRALLVVPHVPDNGISAPEGLVSVWASPRYLQNDERAVDWVFVWRTVEAFIGLPYSLFGSIQLAKSIIEQVVSENGLAENSLKVGTLTYVALSLHMRVDGVHPQIAKLIVDSSSD